MEDNGNVYGLAEDYKLSGNKGQFAIAFRELKPADPPSPDSGNSCVVTAAMPPRLRFAVENGQEIFYIRTGNATNALKPSEMVAYCQKKWPEWGGGRR
ncbi:MAG: hypothetical protein JWL69_3940 [Phycisphaerales bacterium]|jgi:hypothetical protein|nr:hypothetical protein [Phycisphaerales bacterium]MDB5333861.1 hypothetical protein [Phycisphaerales bacterium]